MKTKSDDNPANILEQIREIAHQFRKLISQGKSPRIERFLGPVAEEVREDLFTQLLEIEVNFRRSKSQAPNTDEYLKRFPQFKKQVRRVFFEPTMGSVDSNGSTDSDDQTAHASPHSLRPNHDALDPTYELSNANHLGDYELIRILGQGGMGIVYEALHTKTNNRVALKTLLTAGDVQQVNADKLYRFRKEFRRLSEINHPNLVGMQSLEVDGDRWFFTMDLIDGEDFLSYVRPDDQLDEDRLRSCLKQLATGVMELHRRGIIHRDLKPSNVLVSPGGHVTILDFGLAAQLQRSGDITQTKSGMFAGTPPYAAPEQMFGERTEASDWYAFGTMLFEALAGERPFQDPNPMLLLRRKQEQDPPQLADRDGMPNDLSALADGLLRREPCLRPISDQIGAALGLEDETRLPGSTRDSQGSSGSEEAKEAELGEYEEEETVLIGREKQLAQLEQMKQRFLETRQPSIVWVTGNSGEGKSSLIETFLRPLRKGNEILVLSGRCYDRESVPFKAIDCWIDSLVEFLRRRPEENVESWLPDDIYLLAQLFPVVRRVSVILQRSTVKRSELTDRETRYRAFQALRKLLVSISRQVGVLLFIDDLQWGDADSAEVLFRLLTGADAPAAMLIGTFRSDEADESPFLQEWQRQNESTNHCLSGRTIEVKPLSEDECLLMLSERTGIAIEKLRTQAAELFQDTRGNPYFLEQLSEGFDSETGRYVPVPLHEIIHRRLLRLPPEAAALLKVVAVAGQASSPEEICRAAGHDMPIFSTLTHMRNERLVRLMGSGKAQLVDTYHDRVRETVLNRMKADDQQSHHLRLAEVILESENSAAGPVSAADVHPRVFDLAYHLYEAKDDRAFGFQLKAGDTALAAYALDEALDHLRKAAETLPNDSDAATRFHLSEKLGEVFLKLKDADSALRYFREAFADAESELDRARARIGMAMVSEQRGEFKNAAPFHDLALKEIGTRRPKSRFGCRLSFPFLFLRVFFIPRRWQIARRPADVAAAQIEFLIFQRFGIYLFELDFAQYSVALLRFAAVANRTGHRLRILGAYSMLSSLLPLLSLHRFARRSWKVTEQLCAELDDTSELDGALKMCHGYMLHCFGGDWDTACDELEEGKRFYLHRGDFLYVIRAEHILRHIHAYSGSTEQELSCAERELELSTSLGDKRGTCWGWYGKASAFARAGNLDNARHAIEEAMSHLTANIRCMTEIICRGTHGFVLLQSSSYSAARAALEVSWHIAEEESNYSHYAGRTFPLLIEAIAGPNWLQPSGSVDTVRLRQLLKRSNSVRRLVPLERAAIARARGRAYGALGNLRAASRCFQQAVAESRELKLGWELARSLLDLAAIQESGRAENRDTAIALLKAQMSVIPHAEAWLLGEKFEPQCVASE